MSYGFEYLRKQRRPPASLIERILSAMATLGLVCLCIGVVLHLLGRALSNLAVARFGAYVLLIGILLVVPRIFFWLVVEIAERA